MQALRPILAANAIHVITSSESSRILNIFIIGADRLLAGFRHMPEGCQNRGCRVNSRQTDREMMCGRLD